MATPLSEPVSEIIENFREVSSNISKKFIKESPEDPRKVGIELSVLLLKGLEKSLK